MNPQHTCESVQLVKIQIDGKDYEITTGLWFIYDLKEIACIPAHYEFAEIKGCDFFSSLVITIELTLRAVKISRDFLRKVQTHKGGVMNRNVENELSELKVAFPRVTVSYWKEGGVDFFALENLLEGVDGCILQIGDFLGYQSRLFFPVVMETKSERNWNHKNVLLRDKQYNAFSYRVPDGSLREILLGHLGGLN